MAADPSAETIVAVATPAGRGALAIFRLSGPKAFAIAAKCLKEKALFEKAPPRHAGLYTAVDRSDSKVIDQVTAIKYPAPKSYTGEYMVEIISHGGRLNVKELLDALKAAGGRVAAGGEFTRRALMNGKIDILKAEAIQGIIESESQADLACARMLYNGGSRSVFLNWREELTCLLEEVESWIEFEDDGVDRVGSEKLDKLIFVIKEDLRKRGESIKYFESGGLKVVIAGPPNAGKSTLFNRLLGFNRAIVHSAPGTTRDMVSERMMIAGHEVQVIDCAGIRNAGDEIEKEGIERSREAIQGASIVIWVTAADEKAEEEELDMVKWGAAAMLCIINKIDNGDAVEKQRIFNERRIENIPVSLKEQDQIVEIESALTSMVEKIGGETEIPEFILNGRHEEIACRLLEEIRRARTTWEQPEIAAMHLKGAIACLDEFFGRSDPETIMNRIFEKFCIGK